MRDYLLEESTKALESITLVCNRSSLAFNTKATFDKQLETICNKANEIKDLIIQLEKEIKAL